MGKINGTLVVFTADGSAIAHTQDATLTLNRELPDATTKDSGGWEEHLATGGLRNAEISFDGLADYVDSSGNVSTVLEFITSRNDVPIVWGPAESGSVNIEGDAGFSNLELSAPNEEAAGLSGQAKFNGQPTITTVS